MIDRKYHRLIFAFFMSSIMSCVMSGSISFANLGAVEGFFTVWMEAWAFGFAVAFPGVFVVSPMVHWLTESVLKNASTNMQDESNV